ncbi:MAG: hypothetical protein HOY78_36495 [Saccharothrix sp.]|nr:hypothetical protein [Saccharothrix sp.]
MSIRVVLCRVTQRGTSRRRRTLEEVAEAPDPRGVLDWLVEDLRAAAGTPLLQRIDPIRDVEFSSSHMVQLIEELDRVAPHVARFEGGAEAVKAVRDLAARCRDEPSLVVRFIGD